MGKESIDIFNAEIQYQFRPTAENKKILDGLYDKLTKNLDASQQKKEAEFIEEHGQQLFDFVKSLSKDRFLIGKDKPFYLSWFVADEEQAKDEDDNYWKVTFYKGQFDYVQDICGGYAGSETLEKNISRERVLELMKNKTT